MGYDFMENRLDWIEDEGIQKHWMPPCGFTPRITEAAIGDIQ